ncbi:MAG: hypothetical protein AAF645_23215, partial [Myxococcota bacterium]
MRMFVGPVCLRFKGFVARCEQALRGKIDGTVLSFNEWSEILVAGRTFFGNIDYLTNNIVMPMG